MPLLQMNPCKNGFKVFFRTNFNGTSQVEFLPFGIFQCHSFTAFLFPILIPILTNKVLKQFWILKYIVVVVVVSLNVLREGKARGSWYASVRIWCVGVWWFEPRLGDHCGEVPVCIITVDGRMIAGVRGERAVIFRGNRRGSRVLLGGETCDVDPGRDQELPDFRRPLVAGLRGEGTAGARVCVRRLGGLLQSGVFVREAGVLVRGLLALAVRYGVTRLVVSVGRQGRPALFLFLYFLYDLLTARGFGRPFRQG